MELTIEEALQQGISAHKAGKLEEAERLYRAIIGSVPTHSDANHNLGVLAVGVGKVDTALPYFKTALEANPNHGQYWISYIDALIKLGSIDDASKVLEQGKAAGLSGDAVTELESRLSGSGKVEQEILDIIKMNADSDTVSFRKGITVSCRLANKFCPSFRNWLYIQKDKGLPESY